MMPRQPSVPNLIEFILGEYTRRGSVLDSHIGSRRPSNSPCLNQSARMENFHLPLSISPGIVFLGFLIMRSKPGRFLAATINLGRLNGMDVVKDFLLFFKIAYSITLA